MLNIIRERKTKKQKEYYISFYLKTDRNCGFVFPANSDETPRLENLPDAAKDNYYFCLNNPDFDMEFEEEEFIIVEPGVGKCYCGTEVILGTNDYMGAVECEGCGQWYNLFGQALTAPEYWDD